MKPIRRVLVALDLALHGRALTAGSRLAADHALALAPALDAPAVVLFHSTVSDESWDESSQAYVPVPDGLPAPGGAVLEGVLAQFRAAGVTAELAISPEKAGLGIVRRVLRDGIDLVISGKRNQPDRSGQPLGSVSTKLLRKCPCPVWVVKPDCDPTPRRILAATDLTPVGERVLAFAVFVAEHCDAELHVVHSFQLPLAVQLEGEPAVADFVGQQRQERTRKLEAQLAEANCRRKVEMHVGLTSPTQAILACEERLDPDLVVMGTVSRGGVAGLLVGNTAERLLGRLDCSLLTVKPDDFVCPVSLG